MDETGRYNTRLLERTMNLRTLAAWLAAYLLVSALFLVPLSFDAGERLPDDGDSLQNLWILWWSATHWGLGFPGILDANGYYPHTRSLLFSEPQFAEALLATPLFALFDNHVFVYNLFLVLSLGLSALACHLFVRELAGSDLAASLGAVVYTFNAHTLSHLPRSQLVTLQWMPLGLFFLHRYFAREDARYLVAFVAVSILQGLASFYYLQFYVMALALLVPFYLAHYRGWRPRKLAALGGAALACGVPLLIVTLPYLKRFALYGFAAVPESMEVLDFFRPPADNPIYGFLGFEPRLVSQFLGFGALFLAGLGVFSGLQGRTPLGRWLVAGYLVVGLGTLLLALGPEPRLGAVRLPGPYSLLELTGVTLRDPGRFSVVSRLALALFAGLGAAAFRHRPPVVLAVAGFLLLEQWSPSRTEGVTIPAPPPMKALPRDGAALAELPVRPFGQIRLNALDAYFSTYHGHRYLFGKPSVYPPAHELLRHALADFPAPETIELLAATDVRYIVVHPNQWPEAERARRMGALGRAERSGALALIETLEATSDGAAARYGLGAERVYRITPGTGIGEPRACDCREIDRASLRVVANGDNEPERAIDGDPDTAWTTGLFLERGAFFEIDFGEIRRPVRVEMELRYPFVDLPRGLEFNGFRGDRFFRFEKRPDLAYTVSLVRRLTEDPRGARLRYDLEPMDVDRIRIFVDRAQSPVPGWSLPEIHVFEEEKDGAR